MEGVERHSQESQATIERERVASATVKQLKAEIKDEKAKHEEQVQRPGPHHSQCMLLLAAKSTSGMFYH